ncbi:hypothetical protein TNIN_77501 [Trichonephila inaurata madagascariensis]|uniref:C2H2-type domain-containing protein n=1 Tax=Trichonephila inaurata madagascariensis TaxID=2747483 RepID=A0A8X7BQY3_9ARAC|nr:hypothetical protein TNIN_77501 [Trichonephila inaurata madagascariensis]
MVQIYLQVKVILSYFHPTTCLVEVMDLIMMKGRLLPNHQLLKFDGLTGILPFESTSRQYPEHELLARNYLFDGEKSENTKRTASTSSSSNKFCCEYCLKCFTRKRSLIDHVNIHTGTRPYVCQFCSNTFTQRASCNRHMKLRHPELL